MAFPVREERPVPVGLGGDGDEVDAIAAVESLFGVTLDVSNSGNWITAGDVFSALLSALPAQEKREPDLWEGFCRALTRETGVDPFSIELDSPLLAERVHPTQAGTIIAFCAASALIAIWCLY